MAPHLLDDRSDPAIAANVIIGLIRVASTLLDRQLRIAGSAIASRLRMREMLSFAARHGIAPRVEVRPMDELGAALERLAANQARYRIVLDPRVSTG